MEQTEETFNPNPPVIVSQQKTEERAGGSAGASGVPGAQSTMTSGTQNATSGPERVRQNEVTNYEVNKLVRHTVQPKGTIIQRLSVAAILDYKTAYTKGKDGRVSTIVEPRSQKEIDAYRELVLATVGYDEQRGDVVTIENVPFYSESKPEEQLPAAPWYVKWQAYLLPAMKYGSFIVLFLIVYTVFIRPVRKRVFYALAAATPGGSSGMLQPQLPGEATPKAIAGATQGEEVALAGGAAGALPASEAALSEEELSLAASEEQAERELLKEAHIAEIGTRKHAALKKRLAEKAKKDPELVSQLMRSWLRNKE
jgi:flagellar M-ring protein FliF